AHGGGPRGQRRAGRRVAARGAPGRPGDHPRLEAVQAGEPRMEGREYGRPTPRRRSGRRDGGGGDRRPVLGGVRTADPRSRTATGRAEKPELLKRGLAATIEELLLSAEYLLAEGNHAVILCERGIRGFDTATRNVFDLTAIPVVHKLSHLPIVADPSHGTGL